MPSRNHGFLIHLLMSIATLRTSAVVQNFESLSISRIRGCRFGVVLIAELRNLIPLIHIDTAVCRCSQSETPN